MINRGGPSLIVRIADQTGAAPAAIAAAFAAVRDSYGMTALNGAIDELDNRVSGKLQLDLYAAVQDLLLDRIIWFLRNVDLAQGLADVIAHYRDGIAEVEAALDGALPEDALRASVPRAGRSLCKPGVPDGLAGRMANLGPLTAAPDIVLVADRTGKPVGEVAATYFATGAFFKLDRIASAAGNIPIADYFDRLALDRARDFIGDAERRLDRGHGRQRRDRRARGRGLGDAAQGRSRAYPRRDPRNRQFRPDLIETHRRSEPAWAIW